MKLKKSSWSISKQKGFNVTEDDISFVIGKEETVTGNTKKIKHALIRCDIQIER